MSSIHDKIQKHSPLVKAGSSGGKRDPNISAADIEFSSHVVVVLKKMGEFGTSHFYSAKDDDSLISKKIWRGSPTVERCLLIKATTASTSDEIRRAEKEVKLLRKLRDHGSIPKLIDCGFSTFAEDGRSSKFPEAQSGSAKRLYCMLFEWCPDFLLSDFIALQRRKLEQAKPIRGFLGKFARKSDNQDPGYLGISTVLNIFDQMCEGVKALHTLKKNDPNSKKCGILHLDITPGRFMMRNLSTSTVNRESQSNFKVKLCSFGCAITGTLPLRNDSEREVALQMLKVVTTDIYRAPEMVNLQLSEELTGRCDIWGLGCCFYSLLFLRECFEDSSPLTIMNGKYAPIPLDHPYNDKVLELLDHMLTVIPEGRASIEDVQESIRAIQNGTPLPKRSILTMQLTGTTRHNDEAKSASVVSDRNEDERESDTHSSDNAASADAPLTAYQSTPASSVNGRSANGGYSRAELSATDDHRSVTSSDETQWLELQRENENNEPLVLENQEKSGSKKKQNRPNSQNSRGTDPLNLGETGKSRRKKIASDNNISDWSMGILSQKSTRSLNTIEPESSTDDWADDEGFAVVAKRSIGFKKTSSRTTVNSMSSAATHLLEEGTMNATESSLDRSLHLSERRMEAAISPINLLDVYNGDHHSTRVWQSSSHHSSNVISDHDWHDLENSLPSDFTTAEWRLGTSLKDPPVASIDLTSLEVPMPAMPETIIEPVHFLPGQSFDADKYIVYNPDLDASGDTSSSSDDYSKLPMAESGPALVESYFRGASAKRPSLQGTGNESSAFRTPRRTVSTPLPDLRGKSNYAHSNGVHGGSSDVERIDVDMARATLRSEKWLENAAKSRRLSVKSDIKSDIKSKTSSRKMVDANKKAGKSKSRRKSTNTSDLKPKTQSSKKSKEAKAKSYYLNPDDISCANSSITMES